MKEADLRELALKKVKITGNVIGKFGSFEIEQTYKNNSKDVLEVGYTFPIAETATVVGFEINVAGKVLRGICKEKEKAKEEYQREMVKGNSSYLMEQETDNIFRISVGKIDKDEEVTVKISYIDKFEITDNTIQILLPTLVTPKYKSTITDNLVYGKASYTVDFNINIDKAINRKAIYCPSHEISLIDEEKHESVEVLNYDMSKDFRLDIQLKNELASSAITSKTRDDKDMIYLSFMPEIPDSYEDSEKEYLFIVDVSGSMGGSKIEATKRAVIECLKQLDEGDKFNIIPFESQFEAMNMSSIDFNEENLKKACEYVNNLKPLGGTEILDPIKFALYEKAENKVVLLFTDGQVGNENEIIDFVDTNIGKSRIFPFGIDTNVNSAFIKKLAKVGNGKAELIMPKEKIDDKIIRTFARIQTPLVEDVEIDYGANKLMDEIKEERCLFNYEFFNVFAKVEELVDGIKLKGKILGKEYVWEISKEKIRATDVDLEVLFAKQEMDRLEEYMANTREHDKRENYKKMIVELAEKFNINSKYTSFITVYERDNKVLNVPIYQETTLSDGFVERSARMGGIMGMFGAKKVKASVDCGRMNMAGYNLKMVQPDQCCESGAIPDDGIPAFLRKNPTVEQQKSSRERLMELVDDNYNKFLAKENKSVLTYLLYALYFMRGVHIIKAYDYDELFNFLNENKDELWANEKCMILLCLCYKELAENRKKEKEIMLKLMNDTGKKIIQTNMKINYLFNSLTEKEINEIINNKLIAENINKILEHLIKSK